MSLFPSDFTTVDVPVSTTVNINGVKGGSGPPLLLLHGFPQTKELWNQVAGPLSKSYTVIALDLRGYGRSSKPQAPEDNPDDHSQYSKRTMASDMVTAMQHLGYSRFYLAGHDRGARVSHALATYHPNAVIKLLLLDICPTLAHYSQTDMRFAQFYWHWFFLIQPSPFPEDTITGRPEVFATKQMGGQRLGGGIHVMGDKAWNVYQDQFRDWESAHAMCEDYRAAATVDLEDQKRDLAEGRKITCPTRVLWGRKGVIEMLYDAKKEWSKVVQEGMLDLEGSRAVGSGHYIPEELPDVVVKDIEAFMRE